MISPNELRIGNLLLNNHVTYKVISIDEEGIMADPVSQKHTIDVNIRDLVTPIPLTEEWLLRFGFFGVNKAYFVHNKSKFLLEYTKDLNGDWYIMVNEIPRVYLEHVHQLQNLYFALTGKELTLEK
jgi:hypothetical protein